MASASGWWSRLSSKTDYLPSREDAIGLAGGIGLSVALLTLGAAIGATWVGVQVQATGCTGLDLAGACTILPGVEAWAGRLVSVAFLGFVVAFAVEYHTQDGETTA